MALENKFGEKGFLDLPGVPDDEPVFILRAQDMGALPALNAYWDAVTDLGVSESFAADIDSVREKFETWRLEHPETMKTPD